MKTASRASSAVMVAVLCTGTAWGHHSAAGVDMATTRTASGTLKSVEWTAPHAAVVVAYRDEQGKLAEVAVGTAAPSLILRQGFKRADLRIGSKVQLKWHPNRSGAPGGELESLTLEDGRTLTGGLAPPGAPGLDVRPGQPPAGPAPAQPAGSAY